MSKNRSATLFAAALCVALLNLFPPAGYARLGAKPRPPEQVLAQASVQPKASGKIAFTSGRDTQALDIYVMNPDGSGLARLTDGRSYNFSPTWSPDGRTLAFISNSDSRNFNLYLMNSDGTGVRRLTNSSEDEGTPAWSPDGTKIAFARGFVGCLTVVGAICHGPDIYVVNADGTGEKQLTEGRIGNSSPAWSPDGSRIAFSSLRDRDSEIYMMNPDGTGQVNVTQNPNSNDAEPAWSPDGTKIVFSAFRAQRFDIYVMNPDGTGQTNLTGNTTNEIIEGPAWSPDGTKIAFSRFLLAPGAQSENRDLFVMNADGTNPTRLTTHPEYDLEPDWQPLALAPNGKLSFTSERDGNREIYSMNSDGSSQQNLTRSASDDVTAEWSPDGARLAFASNINHLTSNVPRNIFVMNSDGSGLRKVTANDSGFDTRFYDPTWSPDAKRLAFVNSFQGELSRILTINSDAGPILPIGDSSSEAYDPAWSPDGTRIAMIARQGSAIIDEAVRFYLFVMNADGSGRTRIADRPTGGAFLPFPQFPSGPAWSPDGTRLAFASNREGNAEIYVVNATGGTPVRLTDNPAEDIYPVWSPDGTQIAFTSDRDGSRDIYTMNADDGTNVVRLTSSPSADYDPDWQASAPRPVLPAAQATVQFDNFLYRIPENGFQNSGVLFLRITVTRLGDLSREATVDYSTRDLCADTPRASCFRTASERSDFAIAAGRLRFAPGESAKSFDLHIVDDFTVEGDESFAIELTGAVGVGLGGQARAGVTILDNDTSPPAGNPIDDRTFFVRQHYLDFFSREPDSEGLNFWVGQIPSDCGFSNANTDPRCLAARESVSAAFFLSIEFQTTGFYAHRLYRAAFVRPPRFREFLPALQELGRGLVVGQGGWEQRLEQNKAVFTREFVGDEAFLARYPTTFTPAEFVDALRANAAGAISQDERDRLVAQLSANNTQEGRAQVLRAIAEDTDFVRQHLNPAFVLMQYFGYLRRNPDDPPDHNLDGYNFWLQKLVNHGGDFRAAEMVKAFLLSGEYRSRFTQN